MTAQHKPVAAPCAMTLQTGGGIGGRLTYEQVIAWAKSVNGRISMGIHLGPITVGQLIQLIHDQHEGKI